MLKVHKEFSDLHLKLRLGLNYEFRHSLSLRLLVKLVLQKNVAKKNKKTLQIRKDLESERKWRGNILASASSVLFPDVGIILILTLTCRREL